MNTTDIRKARDLVKLIVKDRYKPDKKERKLVKRYLKLMKVDSDMVFRKCDGCSCHDTI